MEMPTGTDFTKPFTHTVHDPSPSGMRMVNWSLIPVMILKKLFVNICQTIITHPMMSMTVIIGVMIKVQNPKVDNWKNW